MRNNLSNLGWRNHFHYNNVMAGTISGFLAITGASLLFMEAALNGGYSGSETLTWIFTTYFFAGIFSIALPLYYKIPITGGHSLSGITYMVTISPFYSFNELIAGFFVSGVLIFALSISGLFVKILKMIPVDLISAMLAGMILSTLITLISRFGDAKLIVICASTAFILTSYYFKKVPPIFSALSISIIILFFTVPLPTIMEIEETTLFKLYQPDFSIVGALVIGIPLSILILSNDIIVGVNELKKNGFEPENTRVFHWSGVFSIIGSLFGGICTNLAGIMTSICAGTNAGRKDFRYISSIVSGILLLIFAFSAGYLVPLISSLPKGFSAIITFLTLFGVFMSSLKVGLKNTSSYLYTIPTLIISASSFKFFIFNGPIVGLTIGLLILFLIKLVSRRRQRLATEYSKNNDIEI
jgi:benzoate membrane transport protein